MISAREVLPGDLIVAGKGNEMMGIFSLVVFRRLSPHRLAEPGTVEVMHLMNVAGDLRLRSWNFGPEETVFLVRREDSQ